jgi:hypothetical protein
MAMIAFDNFHPANVSTLFDLPHMKSIHFCRKIKPLGKAAKNVTSFVAEKTQGNKSNLLTKA